MNGLATFYITGAIAVLIIVLITLPTLFERAKETRDKKNINSIMATQRKTKFNPQVIQDRIFRQMSAEKKIDLIGQFWRLSQSLSKERQKDGIRRAIGKIR